jgi:predicted secreted acid phosphatase
MSRRLSVSALVVAALFALTAAPAGATTRTPLSPATIRHLHDSGVYGAALARGWARADRALTQQLRRHPQNPVVVLDIDETSLSNYGCLNEVDFALTGLVTCVVQSRSTAIPGARAFVRRAQRRGVRVAFVTGAPAAVSSLREDNLRAVGFTGSFTITGLPAGYANPSLVPYKSSVREFIDAAGYRIIVNVGDQFSDLAGGFARRSIKLPNPIYVTP